MPYDPRNPPVSIPGRFEPFRSDDRPRSARGRLPVQLPPGIETIPSAAVPTYPTDGRLRANGSQIFEVNNLSKLIIDAPSAYRSCIIVRNASASGTAVLYLDFGGDATADSTIRLVQNEMIMLDTKVFQDDLYAFCNEAGGKLSMLVGNIGMPE